MEVIYIMESISEISKLRTTNAEPVKKIKKTLLGGYSKKDVCSLMDTAMAEKSKIVKGYEEQIAELKTSLSMVVRERDNSVSEKDVFRVKCDSLLEQNKQLIRENEELSEQLEILNENLENSQLLEVQAEQAIQNVDNADQIRLELEVENEQLIKNNTELTLKIEKLNEKIIELTQHLTNEKAENKQELLQLQGELHKKDVAFKLKTNNILENLNTIIKEVESINT